MALTATVCAVFQSLAVNVSWEGLTVTSSEDELVVSEDELIVTVTGPPTGSDSNAIEYVIALAFGDLQIGPGNRHSLCMDLANIHGSPF